MNNERYVLGAMLQWEDSLLEGLPRVSEECFTTAERIQILAIIKTMHEKKVKLSVSLIGSLFANDVLFEAMQCVEVAVSRNSFVTHLELLEKETGIRQLRRIVHDTLRNIDTKELGDNPIADMQAQINALALSYIRAKEYNHPESVTEWLVDLRIIRKEVGAIRLPWERLSRLLGGGLYKKRTYVWAGQKKTGKSRSACHATSGILEDDHGVVWFSMEMSASDIHTCILGCRAEVDTLNIHRKVLQEHELSRLMVHGGTYTNHELYIFNNSAITPDFVASGIRSRKQKQRVDVVFIDYIQRMKSGGKFKTRADELESIANRLADIAREEDVALVILSQTTESKDNNAPAYDKLKGSQGILESADACIVFQDLNRGEATPEGVNYREIDATIVQRAGVTDAVVQFEAYLKYSWFREVERPRIEKSEKNSKNNKNRGF